MTSSAADAPRDEDDDDLGDLPEGLLPEGVLDDAAEDDAPARSEPTPSPRKPPPSSSPSRLDARGEDDESALDATVPKVSPVPDLSFTSFTSAPTRYGDRETRAEVASRAATRLPAGRPRGIRIQPKCACGTGGLVFHPRAENCSLTDAPISPRPPPRSQANTWSSSPPGGAKSPGATAPRIPAPRDPVRRRPRPVARARPFSSQAFFSSVTVTRARYRSMGGKFPDGAARRRASRPKPTHETPVDPPRGIITNRAIERDRRIRLRARRTRARASAPRGGVPHRCPGCRASPRPGDWRRPSRRLERKSQEKVHPSPPPR